MTAQSTTADKRGKDPLRRCLVSRCEQPAERMIRFVVAPDGGVVADLARGLPGRGMWVLAERSVLEQAAAKGVFSRAARASVRVAPDFLDVIERGLKQRLLDGLGLARRAGEAVCGFAKAREWLARGRAGLILQASDGSPEECRRFASGAADVPRLALLTAAELGTVFGREQGVHVVVAPGHFSRRLRVDGERLKGVSMRGAPDVAEADGSADGCCRQAGT